MTRVQKRIQDSAELHRIVAEVERRLSVVAALEASVLLAWIKRERQRKEKRHSGSSGSGVKCL